MRYPLSITALLVCCVSIAFAQPPIPPPIASGPYLFGQVNLNDPRLDPKNFPPRFQFEPSLTPAEQLESVEQLSELEIEPGLGDFILRNPPHSPKVREHFRVLLEAYHAELAAHQRKYDPNRKADPQFDDKVAAAAAVARDHIGRITARRGGGVLPAPQCTDLREYQRAHWLAVTTVQSLILKHQYDIDWTPPPQFPDFGPNTAADIERGISVPPLP